MAFAFNQNSSALAARGDQCERLTAGDRPVKRQFCEIGRLAADGTPEQGDVAPPRNFKRAESLQVPDGTGLLTCGGFLALPSDA